MTDLLPQRQSIRLQGYDYSSEGLYFVTICCEDKICYFGKIQNNEMILNEAGKIAYDEWLKTARSRTNIEIAEFIIMPNHLHGIIIIHDKVGAYRIRPNGEIQTGIYDTPLQHNRLKSPSQSLGSIIRVYKSTVTRQINELYNTQGMRIWQRNYYEHIIRDSRSYQHISDYIKSNPANWMQDDYCNNFLTSSL